MRYSIDLSVLILTVCSVGATSCSDDGERASESNPLQLQGSAAASGGAAGTGGAVAGAGSGSADAGAPPGEGVAGSAADGDGGAAPEADPGALDPRAPDAGAEPPAEEPPTGTPEAVGFSDVFAVLQDNCSPCHAMPGSFLPAFAQDDEASAYEVTQETSNNGDELYSERIIERSVVERTMPPGCLGGDLGAAGCLSEEDAALLQAWAEQGALP